MPTLEETRAVEYPPIQDFGEVDDDFTEEGDADTGNEEVPQDVEAVVPEVAGAQSAAEAEPENAEAKSAAEAAAEVTEQPDKAKLFDDLNSQFKDNPVALLQKLMGALSTEQLEALGVGQAAQPEPAPTAAWEPQSEGEEWLQKHTATIEALPQFAQDVSKQFQLRDAYVNDALIDNAVLTAKIDALTALLDVTLPDVDRGAIQKELLQGKSGYADVVKKLYRPALDAAVTHKKKLSEQAGKPRPRTPANGSGDQPVITKKMDMVDIFKLYG